MPFSFDNMWGEVLRLTQAYGYHAVVPVLVADPAGVPWAWIFLLLIAEEAQLNVPLMLGYGFIVLSLCDHALYWIGLRGGRPLLDKLSVRWPKIASSLQVAETAMRGRGVWAITLGRYLPFAGRWVGAGAGLARVPYGRFAIFDALGVGLTVLGFGSIAHFVGRNTIQQPWFPQAVMGAFILSTVLTALITIWQTARLRQKKRPADVSTP
jgi:membrane protein DedA with SNARE-associated domain